MAKILVADDNSNIQKMVGLALKDQGIDVVAVGNGEAAVRKISDVHPDLVLADVFMPVRNGYEVCRYVKEDSALSHIPVILLVGAFDPLDEQEAQRVGADGVLKKPFVPPDPLISMVKSALTRAGVPLGPPATPAPDKTPSRTGADILGGGAGAKLPALSAQRLPEATPEPVEEFPTPVPQVKIPAGEGPVAFGNLLDSTENEEEPPVFSSKPMINIAGKEDWDEPKDVPEEEEQDERGHGGWRPSGADEELKHASAGTKGVADWRDEAFHGNSPAGPSSAHWTPAADAEKSSPVEVPEAPAVAVSTLPEKPDTASSPLGSDAWAAALATGVQEKLAGSKALPPMASEAEPVATVTETAHEEVPEATAANPLAEASAEPATPAPVPETSWEAAAKRAAMLASTWDAAATRSPDETQDIPVYASEHGSAEPAMPEPEPAAPPTYSKQFEHPAPAPAEPAAHEEPTPAEEPVPENAVPKAWENTWETPAPVSSTPVPEIARTIEALAAVEPQAAEPPTEESPAAAEMPEHVSAPTEEPPTAFFSTPAHEAAPEPAACQPVSPEPAAPNMDQLVARVLAKMNPDVLQKVTREILKPVIEAIVRDELDSKK